MNRIFTRQWIQLSAIWTVVAIVPVGRVVLVSPIIQQAWFHVIILISGLLLSPVLILWFNFLQRKKFTWARIILVQIFLSVLLSIWFYYFIDEQPMAMKRRTSFIELQQMRPAKKINFYFSSGNSYSIFTSLMLLSGLGLLIGYNEQLRQRKNKESELQLTLVRSQIKALQSELQPHFLFNTLHAASSLMEEDTAKAQELIERLSFLLRNYLDIIDRQFYSLEEEMEFIQEYIAIQRLRHNGIINLHIHIPAECMALKVPVVLIQPILENSVKHGWLDRTRELNIIIRMKCDENKLTILVKDNGTGTVSSQKTGIGIRNLKDRLTALYGYGYSYTETNQQGYHSQIIIPAMT